LKRRIVLVAVLALALSAPAFAGTWHKSVAAAQKAAQGKKQLILVDMFAEWCGWCHRFEREVFPSEAFQKATSDIVLLRLDTEDRAEGTQFARKYGVTQLPTFLLLSHDLSLAGVIRGYAPPNDFAKALKETRGRYETYAKILRNESAIVNDHPKRLDLAKWFMERGQYAESELRLKKLTTEKSVPAPVRDAAFYQLAMSYALQNRLDEGLKTVRALTAVSKTGDSVERALILAGQIYMNQGNYMAAANEFRSFKKTYPNSPLNANVDMFLPNIERQLASGQK
jgi:thioredoxin-related protein